MQSGSFAGDLLRRPRRLWLRKAVFQIHLWVGLALAFYLVVISISGSVLVYKDELVRGGLPAGLHRFDDRKVVAPEVVLQAVQGAVPGARVNNLQFPSIVLPVFVLDGRDAHGAGMRWRADAVTGRLEAAPHTWVDWMHDLHYYLLLPKSWGMQANGVGALGLLLLAITGIVLWWPGVRVWTRGLRVSWRAGWRRVNYDLHSALGFWTLVVVVWWAFSGTYFAWYRQVAAAVAVVSPIRGMAPPEGAALMSPMGVPTLARVLAAAQTASPQGRLWSVSNPELQGPECYVLLDRGAPGDFSHRDIVRLSRDAQVLSVWHYGERRSFADWVLWLMHPLHFGTLWGPVVKLIWCLLGLSLAGLTVTGVLMYWNRFLRRWSRLTVGEAGR